MLTEFIKINPSEPQNFQKKNSSTFYDNSSNLPTPKIEITLKKKTRKFIRVNSNNKK